MAYTKTHDTIKAAMKSTSVSTARSQGDQAAGYHVFCGDGIPVRQTGDLLRPGAGAIRDWAEKDDRKARDDIITLRE